MHVMARQGSIMQGRKMDEGAHHQCAKWGIGCAPSTGSSKEIQKSELWARVGEGFLLPAFYLTGLSGLS